MGNKSLLELIKHYWYLGILFVILIVVLVIGTNQEKPWSKSLTKIETTSSIAEEVESASVESEVSPTVSEDKNNVFRKESKLFFLRDHQTNIEETEATVESEPVEENEDSSVEVESSEPAESSSYTPTYSNDTYSKPKSSSSKNSTSKPKTSKQPTQTPATEPKESTPVIESKPKPAPAPEEPKPVESEPVESVPVESDPEVIEPETPTEEDSSADSSITE